LPQLKAPNDEETIEMIRREEEEQRERNRRFREHQQQKAMEADASGSDSVSASSENYSEEEAQTPVSDAMEADSVRTSGPDELSSKMEMETSSTESAADSAEWVDQADQSTQTLRVPDPIHSVPRSETFDLTQAEQFRGDVDP
jgi:hypothetical protein